MEDMMRIRDLKQLVGAAVVSVLMAAAPAVALAANAGDGHADRGSASDRASTADRSNSDSSESELQTSHAFTHDESEQNEGFENSQGCSAPTAAGCPTH
jgi:hypothetical protein